MPVVIEGEGMNGILASDQIDVENVIGHQRLVDILGQDGVNLGQTIVLIQMPLFSSYYFYESHVFYSDFSKTKINLFSFFQVLTMLVDVLNGY